MSSPWTRTSPKRNKGQLGQQVMGQLDQSQKEMGQSQKEMGHNQKALGQDHRKMGHRRMGQRWWQLQQLWPVNIGLLAWDPLLDTKAFAWKKRVKSGRYRIKHGGNTIARRNTLDEACSYYYLRNYIMRHMQLHVWNWLLHNCVVTYLLIVRLTNCLKSSS